MNDDITLYYAPYTRASGVRTLLEELQAPYRLHVLNFLAGETRSESYLSVNPLGKVPAITHRGQVVTEQGAIYLYLGDLFSWGKLAPLPDDPLRGPYLRWIVFAGASFEPALIDKALKREPGPRASSPYGDYDAVITLLRHQLREGPYILGEYMTVADILWGKALAWTLHFELVPPFEEFISYVERMNGRPSFERVMKWDGELMAEHKRAAGVQDD